MSALAAASLVDGKWQHPNKSKSENRVREAEPLSTAHVQDEKVDIQSLESNQEELWAFIQKAQKQHEQELKRLEPPQHMEPQSRPAPTTWVLLLLSWARAMSPPSRCI